MKEFSGELIELGPAITQGGWTKYTYIKIGQDLIKGAYVDGPLRSALHSPRNFGQQMKIVVTKWMFRPLIVGLQMPDGQVFRQSLTSMFMASFALLLVAFFLVVFNIQEVLHGLNMISGLIQLGIAALLSSMFVKVFKLHRSLRRLNADHVF